MPRSRTEYHFKLSRQKRIGRVIRRIPLGFTGLGFFAISVFLLFSGVRLNMRRSEPCHRIKLCS